MNKLEIAVLQQRAEQLQCESESSVISLNKHIPLMHWARGTVHDIRLPYAGLFVESSQKTGVTEMNALKLW